MFKLEVRRVSDNSVTQSASFSTENEANAFVNKILSIRYKDGSCPWGFIQREKKVSECSQEELDSALEILPEVLDGDVLIQEARAVLPATFIATITDITAQKAQEEINNNARKFLADSDWKVLRHIREKALGDSTTLTDQQYLEPEQERKEAASRISN